MIKDQILLDAIFNAFEIANAKKYSDFEAAFIAGIEWQKQRSYNEAELKLAFKSGRHYQITGENNFNILLESFKK